MSSSSRTAPTCSSSSAIIDALLDEAAAGGGEAATARLRSRGKLPIRERIANVLDPDSPFLEISPLAAYDSDYTIGGGMVVGIGVIAGRRVRRHGQRPDGARRRAHARTPSRSGPRAIEIARDNRIPYVSFIESAGADLRVEAGDSQTGGASRPSTSPRAAGTSTT